jgi:flagellar biosynthesis/type III secretory pathway M-ring protein FliF/YscJ
MPPQLQALLQNRTALIIIGASLLALVILGVVMSLQPKSAPKGGGVLEKEQLSLATVDSAGKALEIQALLAREGLRVGINKLEAGAGKIPLEMEKDATKEDKDRAIITLVQSGLMDRNIGLEAFDKGDLTASREEKRIKLVRAQQGELARLIRKIDPIQDASISLSIPEPTLFKSDQKPMSASVQVSLGTGERLTRDKVRSIINLVVGAIQGLDAHHVALSDTQGTTYNSVLDLGSEMSEKLEEQDSYMKQKVAAQLDKLLGSGHYVVTVSTLLREVTRETMTQNYDPASTVVQTKQSFSETMNPNGGGANSSESSSYSGGSAASRGKSFGGAAGPASAMMPNGLTSWMASGPPYAYPPPQQNYPEPPNTIQVPKYLKPYVGNRTVPARQSSSQHPYHNYAQTTATVMETNGNNASYGNGSAGNSGNGSANNNGGSGGASGGKGYERSGAEVSYATGRTQTLETAMPGVVEEIAVAVSVDQSHMPPGMNPEDLKALVARAASPKVSPDSVSLIITDFNQPKGLDSPATGSKGEGGQAGNAPGSGAGEDENSPDLPPGSHSGGNGMPMWQMLLLWGGSAVAVIAIITAIILMSQQGDKKRLADTQQALEQLREMTFDQQQQLQAAQAKMVIQEQQQAQQQAQQAAKQHATQDLKDTLKDLQNTFSQQDPAVMTQQLQNWLKE